MSRARIQLSWLLRVQPSENRVIDLKKPPCHPHRIPAPLLCINTGAADEGDVPDYGGVLVVRARSQAGRYLYSSSVFTTSRPSHTSGSSAARTAARSVSFLRIRSAIGGL